MFPRLDEDQEELGHCTASALRRLEDVAVPAKRLIIAIAGTGGVNWLCLVVHLEMLKKPKAVSSFNLLQAVAIQHCCATAT